MKNYQHKSLEALKMYKQKLSFKSSENYDRTKKIIDEMINIIENKETKEGNRIVDFTYTLTTIIDILPLTDYEKMRLFFDIVKVNLILLDARTDAALIPEDIIAIAKSRNIPLESLVKILQMKDKIQFRKTVKILIPDIKKEELESLYNTNQSMTKLKKMYFTLKCNYYDMKGFPTIDEYEKIGTVIDAILMPKDFKNMVKRELKNVINLSPALRKNNKEQNIVEEKTENEEQIKHAQNPQFETRPLLTKKEWYQLNLQADRYYNLSSNREIRFLTPLEKIEFLVILKKLNYTESEIKQILNRLNEIFSNSPLTIPKNNPMRNGLIIYNLFQKLEYYHLTEYTSYIKDILKEMKECSSIKERTVWKRELWKIILEAYQQLPQDNEFEIKKAEQRLQKEKNKVQ